jgi:signal transduction histidine kinase
MLAAVEDPLKPVPLLFVNVPLQSSDQDHPRLVGIAQFILQGDSIAREYAALDRNLIIQSASAFIVGGAILAATILLSFRGIQRANRLLAVQASRLLRANQELALAAKTSAVGAVTSHLIHGLRNPLSGLQGFVKSHVAGEASGSEADWRDAMESTQRMQALVSGVVRILEEQHEVGNYEVSLRELAGMVSARMQPVARAAGIHFHSQVQAEGMLGNREANLAILILENLVQNAFHVTREGGSVWLRIFQNENGVLCEVQDQGPGFPEELRSKLFQPCKSTREGGSGIGLAISKHLAMAITADLELAGSSPNGCTFRLSLPQKLLLAACTPAESIPE